MELIYYIKFDGHEPEKIIVKTWVELMAIVNKRVEYFRSPFEWLIRSY